MHPFSFVQSRVHISRLGRTVFAGLVFVLIFLGLLQFSRPVSFSFGAGPSSPTLQWVDDGPESVEGKDGAPGNETLLSKAEQYVQAILHPENSTFPILKCPSLDENRYDYLRLSSTTPPARAPKYFFALDLHESARILPRLMSTILEVAKFLGPPACTISLVVGDSPDSTYEILHLLSPYIKNLGARYHLITSSVDTKKTDRIQALSKLRNLALRPILPEADDPNTTVIFLNDVSLCVEDILELIHQRKWQNADMTCAMDWTYVGKDPTFYDVWIARGMNGDSFFEVGDDGNWNSAWNLFWNNPESQEKWNANKPFQVFSCWNGALTFDSRVLTKVKFRRAKEGECQAGEPKLFCKDMWKTGFGKIAVVPSVNIEYSDEKALKIKELKGYASELLPKIEGNQHIDWETKPPEKVRCMLGSNNQEFVPWDDNM